MISEELRQLWRGARGLLPPSGPWDRERFENDLLQILPDFALGIEDPALPPALDQDTGEVCPTHTLVYYAARYQTLQESITPSLEAWDTLIKLGADPYREFEGMGMLERLWLGVSDASAKMVPKIDPLLSQLVERVVQSQLAHPLGKAVQEDMQFLRQEASKKGFILVPQAIAQAQARALHETTDPAPHSPRVHRF